MYGSIDDIASTLNERGFPVSRATLAMYSTPHTLWYPHGQFNLRGYQQMYAFARAQGMEEILPDVDMVRGFMSPSGMTPEQKCEAELILSECAMRLAREARGLSDLPGYEEMNKARGVDALRREDLSAPLLDAIRTGHTGSYLDGLAPQREEYRQMMALYGQVQDPDEKQRVKATLGYMRRESDAPPPDNRITINLASQIATLDANGQHLESRVIIGTPDTPTTGFDREVESGIAQKTWYVPPSLRASVGAASIQPGTENPLGAAYFKTFGQSPNGTYVHGFSTSHADLFEKDQRTASHGCVRIENIKEFMAASLAPDAGTRLGYQSNDQLNGQIGQAGENGRWANTGLNNAALATVPGLRLIAVHHPAEIDAQGRYTINHGDPYGLYGSYTAPDKFPATYQAQPVALKDEPAVVQARIQTPGVRI